MRASAAREEEVERGGRGEARRDAPEWPRVPLGELAHIIAGQSPPGSTYRREPVGLPFFQGKADFGDRHPVARVWCTEPNKIAQPGDVLMSIRAPVGPTNVADTECCIGRGLAALRCGPTLDRDYLLWFLRCIEADIAKQGSGSTFDAINRDQLEALEIPLPPLAEQERIAGRLTEQLGAVERARAAAAQRLAAAESLPAALLREVFDGPQASGWETHVLGDLVRTPLRTGISKPGRPESDKRCLTLSAVRGRTLLLDASKPAEVSDADAEGAWLRPGCFYVVRGNGNRELVGRGAFAPDPMPRPVLFPDLLFQIDLGERVDPSFFWCLWTSATVRREIEERARTAAGIYKINTGNLNTLPLRLPDLHTQRRLAADLGERLATAEGVIARSREELAAIEALPASLLRDAFGGSPAPGDGDGA